MYMRQARETGDAVAYQRAEAAFQEALRLLPGYSPAKASLASAYYAQHKFLSALELARAVYRDAPRNTQVLATIGDAQLALGRHREAEAAYQRLTAAGTTPAVLARLAALKELRGDPQEALRLMRRAAADALHSGDTRESVAWYLVRVGDLYFSTGKIEDADDYYNAALRVYDGYYLALVHLGEVRAAEGRYLEAIEYYRHTIDIVPDLEALAALGDLYMLTDRRREAQRQYRRVEYVSKRTALNRRIYNRQLANFYSTHNIHLKDALRLALMELEFRKDVYGYEAAAWAYYQNGRLKEAKDLLTRALALGTRDALLFYEAGMIDLALGNHHEARRLLEEALTINPHFSLVYANEARKTLESLREAKTNV
jgi:tetratricopeptide (TPR) repeat protein